MNLSAAALDTFDRCERRFAFSREWESKSISPTELLYKAVEGAILSPTPEQTAKDITLATALTHELQTTDLNAFMVTRHVGYLAGIIAIGLQRKFGEFTPVPISTTEDFVWESALFRDRAGTNHRIALVSHLDDDRLRGEAHSWRVVGELAALQAPLTLTAVVIGPHRGGRRHSAWAKGHLHPQNHVLRFAKRVQKGSGFSEGWEDVWREHRGEISTETWLGGMERDGVLGDLIVSREIGFRASDPRMVAARREMVEVGEMMERATPSAPMRRHSCDETGRGACGYQTCCYAPVETSPSRLVHIYSPRQPKPSSPP